MPARIDLAAGVLAGGILLAISIAVLRQRRRPYLFTGWFWYVGTLVPVIGIIQVGVQSHADRYTYVPLVGIFIAIVWSGAELAGRQRGMRLAAAGAAGVVVAALAVRTWFQVAYWRDSETLYEHALAVAPENPIMHQNLASLLVEHGRIAEAIPHYRVLVRVRPERTATWINLALSLAARGYLDEARRTLDEMPAEAAASSARVHQVRASLALQAGDLATALREAKAALRLEPDSERARNLLERVYVAQREGSERSMRR